MAQTDADTTTDTTDADPPLRFPIGTRVEANCQGWRSGTIVGHWWADASWPRGKVVPYQIKLDHGQTIFAPMDSDRCVRRVRGFLQHGRIPVTILTGFLGAGKTTLLNYILTAQHGKKYAIIENEFGDVPIDDQLLDMNIGPDMKMAESISVLDNGCLCCTVRDDLVQALSDVIDKVDERYSRALREKRDPTMMLLDGILIETTGMADPGPIINTFSKGELKIGTCCKVDGVITVVDCKHFLTQLHRERTKDAVNESAQQVGHADKILLNKVDVCTRAEIEETKEAVRGINAVAQVLECQIAKDPKEIPIGELLAIEAFDAAKLLAREIGTDEVNLLQSADLLDDDAPEATDGYPAEDEGVARLAPTVDPNACPPCTLDQWGGNWGKKKSRHDTEVKSMVLETEGCSIELARFNKWIGTVIAERSVDLYRYKGVLCVSVKGVPSLFILQGVHDMPDITFSGKWPEGKPMKTQVVIIGRKLDKERYTKEFEALSVPPEKTDQGWVVC